MSIQARGQLSDLADELAVHELHLDACAVWRLVGMVTAPLVIALLADMVWVTALCWIGLALMYYPLLRGWGYTALAIMLSVLPAYAYLEWNGPPNWLAFVAAFVGFCAVIHVMERLKSIRALRSYKAEQDRSSDSGLQAGGVCRRKSVGG